MIESTIRDERAIQTESTRAIERAGSAESTRSIERAILRERTIDQERANLGESTMPSERAIHEESAMQRERAKFPRPWRLKEVGPADYAVFDANDRFLFVVAGVENSQGEDEPSDASVLTWSGDDEDDNIILGTLEEMLAAPE